LLERIGSRARFAVAIAGGEVVGIALGVVEARHMGIFAFHTLSTHRRAGVGESMLAALAGCAQDEGVKTLYLQVERSNSAALALYARCGFRHRYGYHYRVAG
jgi:ribosomal protein S18 acetylase RimI-like enzyme